MPRLNPRGYRRAGGLFAAGVCGMTAACHTLEGAAAGAGASLYLLASSGEGGSSASPEFILIFLAAGPVIGAVIGAGQDFAELWQQICDANEPGVPWDSREGRRLRMAGGSIR